MVSWNESYRNLRRGEKYLDECKNDDQINGSAGESAGGWIFGEVYGCRIFAASIKNEQKLPGSSVPLLLAESQKCAFSPLPCQETPGAARGTRAVEQADIYYQELIHESASWSLVESQSPVLRTVLCVLRGTGSSRGRDSVRERFSFRAPATRKPKRLLNGTRTRTVSISIGRGGEKRKIEPASLRTDVTC